MSEKSVADILGDFSQNEKESNYFDDNKAITVWLPEEYKLKYDQIQRRSKFKFCKKLRDLIIVAIETAESRSAPQ